MSEPPLPTPYVPMLDGEAHTATEAAKPCLLDAEAQTPGKSEKHLGHLSIHPRLHAQGRAGPRHGHSRGLA